MRVRKRHRRLDTPAAPTIAPPESGPDAVTEVVRLATLARNAIADALALRTSDWLLAGLRRTFATEALVAHQLLSAVWNIALAAALGAAAFGRSGGKRLVEESSTGARELRAAPWA